jgi:uncharacterized protein
MFLLKSKYDSAISMRFFKQKCLKNLMNTALLAFACMHAVRAQTSNLDQARSLIAQRQFQQAEVLLRSEREGPVRDTLLAQALIGVRESTDNPERTAQALTLLQRAAAAGYPGATYPLASIYASSGRVADARQLLQPLAAQQDARALYLLGRISEALREYTNAAQLYERSAHQGNGDALNNLGFMHANGNGVARDDVRAARYYRDAIASGSLEAAINLVVLADANRTSLQGNETREALLAPAAQQGQPIALRLLGREVPAAAPLAPLTPPAPTAPPIPSVTVARAPATLPAPAQQAAAASTVPVALSAAQAQELLAQARRLQRGEGVMRDLARAATLLEQAAQAGLADAQRALADVYDYGLGVVSNARKAAELRKTAAGR